MTTSCFSFIDILHCVVAHWMAEWDTRMLRSILFLIKIFVLILPFFFAFSHRDVLGCHDDRVAYVSLKKTYENVKTAPRQFFIVWTQVVLSPVCHPQVSQVEGDVSVSTNEGWVSSYQSSIQAEFSRNVWVQSRGTTAHTQRSIQINMHTGRQVGGERGDNSSCCVPLSWILLCRMRVVSGIVPQKYLQISFE